MRRLISFGCVTGVTALLFGTTVFAEVVAEVEPNDPIGSSQFLSIPASGTVSVAGVLGTIGGANVCDLDFYSFQGAAGNVASFDIINGTGGRLRLPSIRDFDSILGLFGSGPGFPLIAQNDDFGDSIDSRINNFTLPSTGEFTVGVSNFPRFFSSGRNVSRNTTNCQNGDYTLVISGVTPGAVEVAKTLFSGPQQQVGDQLVDVPNTNHGEILVNHDQAQFFAFEIVLTNNTGQAVSRVFSDAISETFDLSEDGEDADDGAIDGACVDGTCDGIMLDQFGTACSAQAFDPEDADEALGDVFEVESMLVIVCDNLADGDTATLTVWVETDDADEDDLGVTRFNPVACLEIANVGGVSVNETLTLNPGVKEYDPADGSLLSGPAQAIQLVPVPTDGCIAAVASDLDDDDDDDDN